MSGQIPIPASGKLSDEDIRKAIIAISQKLDDIEQSSFSQYPGNTDLTNAVKDYTPKIGETCIIRFSNSTVIPLHIATEAGTLYEMSIALTNAGAEAATLLKPNNTTYPANSFVHSSIYTYNGGAATVGRSTADTTFILASRFGIVKATIFNAGTGAGLVSFVRREEFGLDSGNNDILVLEGGRWYANVVSWTSLGTVSNSTPISGTILVKRLA